MRSLILAFLLMVVGSAHAQSASVSLDDAPLSDFVKVVYGEIAKVPYVMTGAVSENRTPVSVSMINQDVKAIIRQTESLLVGYGFQITHLAGVVVIEKKKIADEQFVFYKPRYRSSKYLLSIIEPLTRAKVVKLDKPDKKVDGSTIEAVKERQQPQAQPQSVKEKSDGFDLDQIAVMVPADKAVQVAKLFAQLDQPTGEILLKAAVYEVGTNKAEGSALQLALSVAKINVSLGSMVNGSGSIRLATGGLDAVMTALDADSRFRSVSRPQVRVKNGATARFSVGQEVPVLGSTTIDKSGNPVQSVEYKQSGIILTATPEIRENVIDIELGQEMSNFVITSTGVNNSPTLIRRAVNTRLSVRDGEVAVLAGLQGEKSETTADRLPFVGWLLGSSQQQESTEVLVFVEASRI